MGHRRSVLRTDAVGGVVRGLRGLNWCCAEARRACDAGIRGLLVADLGVLNLVATMRRNGDLPDNLVIKTSVMLPCRRIRPPLRCLSGWAQTRSTSQPIWTIAELAELRQACDLPIDIYVEAPADQGGFVRLYEIVDLVRALAPVHLKFGIRNSPSIYPMGGHLADVADAMTREKVRRAALGLRMLEQLAPELFDQVPLTFRRTSVSLCRHRLLMLREVPTQ